MTARRVAMRAFAIAFVCTVLASAPTRVEAEPVVFELDASRTRVEFTLEDFIGNVRGTFKARSGTIQLDPDSGAASGAIVVIAGSGESGNRVRDREMHRSILETERFPDITFTPSRVRGGLAPRGESRLELDGVMELHGGRHPLTATVVVTVAGVRATTDARFTIPYVAWGLRNPSMLLLRVGDTVDIHVSMEGTLAAPLEPSR